MKRGWYICSIYTQIINTLLLTKRKRGKSIRWSVYEYLTPRAKRLLQNFERKSHPKKLPAFNILILRKTPTFKLVRWLGFFLTFIIFERKEKRENILKINNTSAAVKILSLRTKVVGSFKFFYLKRRYLLLIYTYWYTKAYSWMPIYTWPKSKNKNSIYLKKTKNSITISISISKLKSIWLHGRS